jgi:signal peptidase II
MNEAEQEKLPRAWRLKGLALALVVVGVVLDLWSKGYMQEALGMSPDRPGSTGKIEVIEGFFRFEGNWNTGVTFGIAQGWTEPILIFTVLASAGLCAWLVLTRSRSALLHVALGMILAGALGNLYDRFTWHKVRDFVLVYWKDPSVWQWPAFNVADSLIVVGVCFILGIELFGHRPPTKAAEQPS